MMGVCYDPAILMSVLFAALVLFRVNDAADDLNPNEAIVTVTSIEMEPYVMRNPDYINGTDPPQYEYIGYIPDLIDKLSHVLGFNYVIHPVPDRSFGHQAEDGSWDGIIGELVDGRANLAAGPMYATAQRSAAVDFTDPFLPVYATILIRRPHSPNRIPQITSLKDLLRQSEIRFGSLNRGPLVRAFRHTNVSIYQTAWRQMARFRPSVFTATNAQGIERLRLPGERYAFIIPHPIGDFVATRKPCDLVTVGRFLAHRGYSLAVPRDVSWVTSTHGGHVLVNRSSLNAALRTLTDSGFLEGLYRKWWTMDSKCPMATNGGGNGINGSKRQVSVVADRGGAARLREAANMMVLYGGGHEPWSREVQANNGFFSADGSSSSSIGRHLYGVTSFTFSAAVAVLLAY